VAAVAALFGCRGDTDTPEDGDTVEITTSIVGLPFGSYIAASESVTNTVDSLTRLAANECLLARGFNYTFPVNASATSDPMNVRYGLTDSSYAAAWGYGGEGPSAQYDDAPAPPPDVIGALYGAETRRVDLVDANGDSLGDVLLTDGCMTLASVEVFGSVEKYTDFVRDRLLLDLLAAEAYDAAVSSPLAQEAFSAWSSCMQRLGFADYESPYQASDRDWRQDGNQPTEEERRTAVADVACKAEVDYVEMLIAAEAIEQNARLDSFSPLLDSFVDYARIVNVTVDQ
jgi:hypothetical protein